MISILKLRNSKATKVAAILSAISLVDFVGLGNVLKANAGGPTQPEYSKPTVVSASDLVDPFSGNVKYSVPLFEIGGYPVTMSYGGDINQEKDAGHIGLGWNLNLGSINRALRGVPDDFLPEKDFVKTTEHKKPHRTYGIGLNTVGKELTILSGSNSSRSTSASGTTQTNNLLSKKRSLKFELTYDNYTGLGLGFASGTRTKESHDIYDVNEKGEKKEQIGSAAPSSMSKFSPKFSYNTKTGRSYPLSTEKKFKNLATISGGLNFNSQNSSVDLGIKTGDSKKQLQNGYNTNFFSTPGFTTVPRDQVSRAFSLDIDLSKVNGSNNRVMAVKMDYSVDKLRKNGTVTSQGCLGYLYHDEFKSTLDPTVKRHKQDKDKKYITDVEEVSNQVGSNTRKLNNASVNYDVFNISAAGVGGSFRAHQNQVIMQSAPNIKKAPSLTALHGKFELGGGASGDAELGVNVGVTIEREKYSGLSKSDFKGGNFGPIMQGASTPYRPGYDLRNDFEFIENDNSYSEQFKGTELSTVKLPTGFESLFRRNKYFAEFSDKDGKNTKSSTSAIEKTKRDARQQIITKMTADLASKQGFMKQLQSYQFDLSTGGPIISATPLANGQSYSFSLVKIDIDRNVSYRSGHHISEFTVLQPDGSRYYFGTPVYNRFEKDVIFSIQNSAGGHNTYNYLQSTTHFRNSDIPIFDQNGNVTIHNTNGVDHYCSEKETPAYAHSYLLNAVLSPDYVDKKDDGPTEDDLGNYVKINYGMTCSDFNWRTNPYHYQADLILGVKSDKQDDKARFTYGQKELWYTHSIETKDQIAFFYLENRLDGYEAIERFGGMDPSGDQQKRLKKVVLYTKNEFNKNGLTGEPLKVINLHATYELCKNYEYSPGTEGKLTLKEVSFTYGKYNIPLSAPYKFNYNSTDPVKNPDYYYRQTDRWGTYRPWVDVSHNGSVTDPKNISKENSQDYPYVYQGNASNDDWASAWMMSDITLPSGGTIHIDYEADDYQYVQDRKAQQMYKVVGLSESSGGTPNTKLHKGWDHDQRYVIIERPTGVNSINDIIKPIDNSSGNGKSSEYDAVYFKFLVDMLPTAFSTGQEKEYVSGFIEPEEIGDLSGQLSYIKMKFERAGLYKTNPVSRAAIAQGLANTPWLFYPNSDLNRGFDGESDTYFKKIASSLLSAVSSVSKILLGKYKYFINMGYCKNVDLASSYVRLDNGFGKKVGGGHRVKKVSLTDNWNSMTGTAESNASYNTVYSYTLEDGTSSGVASWEPGVGGDENPHKTLRDIDYKWYNRGDKGKKAKDFTSLGPLEVTTEMAPIGEEYYPSPSVGYSRVKVSTEYPEHSNSNSPKEIKRHKTGYTEYEFYTAKDFPTRSERTKLFKRMTRVKDPFQGLKQKKGKEKKKKWGVDINVDLTYRIASQGFIIRTNDMHGKPKSNKVYLEGLDGTEDIVFSGSEYIYKTDDDGNIANHVDIVRPDGSIESTECGLDIEPVMFGSKYTSTVHQIRPAFDLDFKASMPIPGFFPGYALTRTNTKCLTTTKLVRRRGIVDKVVVYDKGAVTSTKNLAWDALTGQVLLSSVENEYGDNIYSLTKPAHWMYESIGGAYQNIEHIIKNMSIVGGAYTDTENKLYPGDEIVSIEAETYKFWVLDKEGPLVTLIDKDGNMATLPNSDNNFMIVRSGHRNILGVGAETISTMQYPVENNQLKVFSDQVIAGKGITLDDKRQVYRGSHFCWNPDCANSQTGNGQGSTEAPEHDDYFVANLFACCNAESSPLGTSGYFIWSGPNRYEEIHSCPELCESAGYAVGDKINPYTLGIWGVWKPFGNYAYHDKRDGKEDRTQTNTGGTLDGNTTNIRYDGRIKNYKEFWNYQNGEWVPRKKQDTLNPWVWTETMQHVDDKGNPVQSFNALDIYSTSLYGYNDRRLTTATAANAKHQEILFDGFEDIDPKANMNGVCSGSGFITPTMVFGTTTTMIQADFSEPATFEKAFCDEVRHWPVSQMLVGNENQVTDKYSHTGWHSLQLGKGNTSLYVQKENDQWVGPPASLMDVYKLQSEDFIHRFLPTINKKYLISMWVKTEGASSFALELDCNSSGSSLTPYAKTAVDDWTKYDYYVNPSSQNWGLSFNHLNSGTGTDEFIYIDDIRIHPADASFQSYVYDQSNYRLMSVLDDNNFASFFEYDESGALIRKKVETERGVMTVSETRNHMNR